MHSTTLNEKGQSIVPSHQMFTTWVVQAWSVIPEGLIRKSWEDKYGDILVGMTTTSLYGTHSQYNSMPTFKKRGKTTGKMPIKLPKDMVRVWEEYFGEKRKTRSNLDTKIYRECGMKPKDYQSGMQRGKPLKPQNHACYHIIAKLR